MSIWTNVANTLNTDNYGPAFRFQIHDAISTNLMDNAIYIMCGIKYVVLDCIIYYAYIYISTQHSTRDKCSRCIEQQIGKPQSYTSRVSARAFLKRAAASLALGEEEGNLDLRLNGPGVVPSSAGAQFDSLQVCNWKLTWPCSLQVKLVSCFGRLEV